MELYSTYRKNIKNGDLLLWNIDKVEEPVDYLLKLTQFVLRVKYSHVGIAINLYDRLFCLEAVRPYVRLIPLSKKSNFAVIHTNINWKESYYDVLFKYIGYPYNVFDVIRYVINIKNTQNSFYCTKLVADYYNSIGFVVGENAGATPKTLIDAVQAKTNNKPIDIFIDRGNLNGL
jgi:hypothetical protein